MKATEIYIASRDSKTGWIKVKAYPCELPGWPGEWFITKSIESFGKRWRVSHKCGLAIPGSGETKEIAKLNALKLLRKKIRQKTKKRLLELIASDVAKYNPPMALRSMSSPRQMGDTS